MARSRVILGTQYFPDWRIGRPVANGSVYIGEVDLDPRIEANRKTVYLIQEDGTEVPIAPASQPLTTGAGGTITYDGSPVQVQTDDEYSIAVLDSIGDQVFYFNEVVDNLEILGNFVQAANFYTNDVSSASNAYVIIPPVVPAPDSLLDGQLILFRPSDNGSGAATINVVGNGGPIGAYSWVLPDGTNDLPADYIKTTRDYMVRWDSANEVFIDIDMGLFSYNPSIQVWNEFIDYYTVPSYVTGSDGNLYKSKLQSGPNLGGDVDPVGDTSGTWVLQQAAGNYSGVVSVTTTPYAVLADDVGKQHSLSGSASALTLPQINSSSLVAGKSYSFVNYLSTNCTIAPDAADTFVGTNTINGSTTLITVPPYSAVIFTVAGSTTWNVTGIYGGAGERILAAGAFSASAQLNFVLSTLDPSQSPYNMYQIDLVNTQPGTNDIDYRAIISSDGGSSFVNTNYKYCGFSFDTANEQLYPNSSSAAFILVSGDPSGGMSNVSGETGTISIKISSMNTGSSIRPIIKCQSEYWDSNAGEFEIMYIGGSQLTAADYDAIRIYPESGNFAAVGYYVLKKLMRPV